MVKYTVIRVGRDPAEIPPVCGAWCSFFHLPRDEPRDVVTPNLLILSTLRWRKRLKKSDITPGSGSFVNRELKKQARRKRVLNLDARVL